MGYRRGRAGGGGRSDGGWTAAEWEEWEASEWTQDSKTSAQRQPRQPRQPQYQPKDIPPAQEYSCLADLKTLLERSGVAAVASSEAPSDQAASSGEVTVAQLPDTPSVTEAEASVGDVIGTFGVIIYDLETVHDAEKGTYHSKGLYECTAAEQQIWKSRSQIIEFAAIDVRTGQQLVVRCRPEFKWSEIRSPAARLFAADHGHDRIIQDESLPVFRDVWASEILPFLVGASGSSKTLAMIAHNGDNFDHFVLDKELVRLDLVDLTAPPVNIVRFDPIRTLKNTFGKEFGNGGKLALKHLHTWHVPTPVCERPQHEALGDCLMLLEVLSHWDQLRALLVGEIAAALAVGTTGTLAAAAALIDNQLAQPLEYKEVSKKLSWILRHGATHSGITMNSNGWVKFRDLVGSRFVYGISEARLMDVILLSNEEKPRYELRLDPKAGTNGVNAWETTIRAIGKHSQEFASVRKRNGGETKTKTRAEQILNGHNGHNIGTQPCPTFSPVTASSHHGWPADSAVAAAVVSLPPQSDAQGYGASPPSTGDIPGQDSEQAVPVFQYQ